MFTVLELWSSRWIPHQWPLTCWNWRGASRRPAPDPCCWGSSGADQPAGRTPLRSGPCPQNFPTLPGKAKGKRNTLSAPEDIQRGGGRVFRFNILKTHVPTSLLETFLNKRRIFPHGTLYRGHRTCSEWGGTTSKVTKLLSVTLKRTNRICFC